MIFKIRPIGQNLHTEKSCEKRVNHVNTFYDLDKCALAARIMRPTTIRIAAVRHEIRVLGLFASKFSNCLVF